MQSLRKCILHDIRASQYNVEIDIGTSRDKGHFFPSKIDQRKLRQRF